MENPAPTKSNLMNAKSSLILSVNGFELLDKKRNVLIREIMNNIDRAERLQKEEEKVFNSAYEALIKAVTTSGLAAVEDIALGMQREMSFDIIFKSIMGVEIPHIKYNRMKIKTQYGFYKSNSAVDMAFESFIEAMSLIYELAEVENTIYRLAMELKKTQKRANALENIQIPKLKGIIKYIGEVLEEKEREDFFRLKVIKHKKA